MKKKIILVGAGGHCASCVDVIEKENKYQIYGLVDEKKDSSLTKYKLIGNDADLKKIKKKTNNALITIGQIKDLLLREKVFQKLIKLKFNLPVIVAPSSYVSESSFIDKGTIIMQGAIVNSNVKIGKNCIINTGSIIEHNVVIGNNCHISTGCIINGGTIINDNTFIGSGSVIKQHVKIGARCFVNAKKFIDKNLKDNSKLL
jgi:sugar O-acyltransferase (sialic acid O-acetyltransferase NeuD family)